MPRLNYTSGTNSERKEMCHTVARNSIGLNRSHEQLTLWFMRFFLFSLYELMTTSDQFRPRHMLAGFIQLYTILMTSCLTVIKTML